MCLPSRGECSGATDSHVGMPAPTLAELQNGIKHVKHNGLNSSVLFQANPGKACFFRGVPMSVPTLCPLPMIDWFTRIPKLRFEHPSAQ